MTARRRSVPDRSQVNGTPLTAFGVWLAEHLNQRGWNQAQFAETIGVLSGTVATWLYRETPPRIEACAQIATGLGVPLWRVLEAAGRPYDGLQGVPANDLRRRLWAKIERMSDDEVLRLLGEG